MTGKVFWITGLSGAGKSENAVRLEQFLKNHGRACVRLDGDEMRMILNSNQQASYTRSGRIQFGLQYLHLCKLISSQGVDVVSAAIGLYNEFHEWRAANLPDCMTIYLDVPIEELRRRDPKQLYARFFAGEISNVPGLDLKIDPPRADVHIRWQNGMDAEKVWRLMAEKVSELL